MFKKTIITAALTGAVTSRSDTPYLPLTKEEIAAEALRCANAGATIVHLHLRDSNGLPVLSPELFAELVAEVRSKADILICLSTSSWGTDALIKDRLASTAANPDLVTFHVGSMNRGKQIFANPLEYQEALAQVTKAGGIKPEFEIFDLSQISRALEIQQSFQFPTPFYVQFVLGVKGGCPAEPRHLLHMVETLPQGTVWSVAAVGQGQLPMNLMGLILGGQVRTGLEDNIYLNKGVLATSNAVLVERLAKFSRELGRDIASVEETKAILGLGK